MQTWDDCVAALRTGAPPEQILPRIRELFSKLPPTQEPAADSSDPSPTPLSRLFVDLPYGAGVAQIPYLRPPFHLWSAKKGENRKMYDSELQFDLTQLFQPMFIAPPEAQVREMLQTAVLGMEVIDQMQIEYQNLEQEEKIKVSIEDIDQYAEQVEAFLGEEANVCAFPILQVEEWALILSQVDKIQCADVKRLLLSVNQPSLAYVILYAVVPRLVHQDMTQFIRLVDTAAANAELYTYPVDRIHSLLQLYRDMDAGVMGALAQLKVISHLRKR